MKDANLCQDPKGIPFDGDGEWQREWNDVISAEEGVGSIFNGGDDEVALEMEPLTTTITATKPSSSPPRFPQQTEDAVYQAFVRQWCFARASGPTVGANLSAAAVAVVGGMAIVMDMVSGRALMPGGSGSGVSGGSGGGGCVSLEGVGGGVGVVEPVKR